jgi:hypothetical protein
MDLMAEPGDTRKAYHESDRASIKHYFNEPEILEPQLPVFAQ